jgi:hypothetical protein
VFGKKKKLLPLVGMLSSMTFHQRHWRRQNGHRNSFVTFLWRFSIGHRIGVTFVTLWRNEIFRQRFGSKQWRTRYRHGSELNQWRTLVVMDLTPFSS